MRELTLTRLGPLLGIDGTAALQNAIFNSTNFSSIATDRRGIIQVFNVGAERMLGYVAEDVVHKLTPADVADPKELIARAQTLSAELGTAIIPGFEAMVIKASRGIEDIYELTHIRKDGSRLPVLVSVTALRDPNDAIIGYLLIGTDNTARKQLEDERIERAIGRLASGIAHDFNNLLSVILSYSEIVGEALKPGDPMRADLDTIRGAGLRAVALTRQLLGFGRQQARSQLCSRAEHVASRQ